MRSNERATRLLGAMFLVVVVTSFAQGTLATSAVGSGDVSENLAQVADNVPLLRASILAAFITSGGIVLLATLLYAVLRVESRILALFAIGCWVTEAVFNAVGQLGAAALIPLSRDFVAAGAPAGSYYLTLGEFLYSGVDQMAYSVHMFFYLIGGVAWYYLFYRSRFVPRVISGFGLVAVGVALVGIVVEFLGTDVTPLLYLPILPFELAIGAWLLFRGVPTQSPAPAGQRAPATGSLT